IGAMLIAVLVLSWSDAALAGPPLIADDPNTIGAGHVLPIISTSVIDGGGETLVRAPILDLTVGIVESLDFTLLTPLISRRSANVTPSWSHTTVFAPGLKWQFFETDRGSLCVSPAFYIDAGRLARSFALLPIEGELKVGRRRKGTIGFDLGYQPVVDATHEWFVAPYADYMVNPKLDLLFELWCLGSGATARTGGSLGVNTGPVSGHIRALAAVGTGFVSFGAARVDVRAYLGVQYMFSRP
ncbi:MAG: hypothetical protein PVH76_12850, partial [Myxococcales bacterium]